MKKRLITGLILGIVLVPLFVIQELYIPFIIVMGILACASCYELIHVAKSKITYKLITYILSILGSALVYVDTIYGVANVSLVGAYGLLYLIPIFIPVLVLLALILFKRLTWKDFKVLALAIYYPAIGFGLLSFIHIFEFLVSIYIVLICMLTDVFAYVYGMLFGAHPLTKISPKKSVEGSVAGTLVAAFVGTWFASFFNELVPIMNNGYSSIINDLVIDNKVVVVIIMAILSIVLSIISQFGDLFASKIKREYDVKDYSNIFPGHGGVMDRFDSTLLTTIATYILLILIRTIFL